jgi:RNA polymerase sigma-70 factor (ECF subfamily)
VTGRKKATPAAGGSDARVAAEAAARRSYGKLVAFLAARSRDVAGAEDALADAFAAALAQWLRRGVPQRPEAWLLAVARRRALDAGRRRRTRARAEPQLLLLAEEAEAMAGDTQGIPDERLRLLFACADPGVEPAMRAPLMLQAVLGFDAAAIASAFLVPPSAMAQRLVRAKARIREAGLAFAIPERREMAGRLDAVLAAIYAAFSEGWTDAAGAEARRRNLAGEAIWLARLVAGLLPREPEALSLLALMLFAEARRPARRDAAGAYVPLAEQDWRLWDAAMTREAEALLREAGGLEGIGRYQLEAAVQAVHAARRLTGRTDWPAVARLYEALAILSGSPVVAINRAVALAEAEEPAAGLALLDTVADAPGVEDYQPYWAARAELLARCGDVPTARAAFARAVGLERDAAVREFLMQRSARLLA